MKIYTVNQLVSKFGIVSLLVALSTLLGVNVQADPTLKLAVADAVVFQQQLLVEVDRKLEQKFKSKHDEIQKLIEEFNKDNDRLKKEEKTMHARKLAVLKTELKKKQATLQKQVRQYEEEMNVVRQEELKSRLDKLMGIIKDISTKNQYDMVLAKNIALYVDAKYDITEQISKKYDELSTDQKAADEKVDDKSKEKSEKSEGKPDEKQSTTTEGDAN